METNEVPQSAQKGQNTVWKVYDANQRGEKPRKHEIIVRMPKDGGEPETVTYDLYSATDKPCPMPMEHAIKFLCDASFKVLAPNGNRVMPIERIDLSRPISKLAHDEVVVKYNVLSRDYLFKLVKMTPGSEDVKVNATSDELAEFMVKWRESLVALSQNERKIAEMMASGEMGGSMNADQLDKMFGDRKVA